MFRLTLLALLSVAMFAPQTFVSAAEPVKVGDVKDWPWWRGPHRDGIASADQTPPVEFSDTKNVLWKAPLAGRGHGSAIVVGSRVFIQTADEASQVQAVVCFDRSTGKELWNKEIHKGHFIKGGNGKSSHASSTPACDGERVFVNFINHDAVYTTALNLEGKQIWQTKISNYVIHQGYGSSPAVYGPLVIVMADNKGGGAVAGLDRTNGKIVWKEERPKLPNYPSPSILNIGGRDQVLLTGCDLVTSFDPLTGKKIWETKASTTECVTTVVTDGRLIFTSGGYPKDHISGVLADGSGKVVWENNKRVYVPSMLVRDNRLYCVLDKGIAMCFDSATGKELFNLRLPGGDVYAAPVLVGDKLYVVNEAGTAFVVQVQPDAFKVLAENKLGDEAYAAPTICGSQIFLRVASKVDGKRQEWLYCFGQKP